LDVKDFAVGVGFRRDRKRGTLTLNLREWGKPVVCSFGVGRRHQKG